MKVLDLCVGNESKKLSICEEDELFEYWGGNWKSYIDNVNRCNLDDVEINIENVDKEVFILSDGGELFRLKNGEYIDVCWRGDCCRVWGEEDEELINYMNKKLK